MAFEFPEEARERILDYLRGREGKGFDLRPQWILLEDGRRVQAIVPIYFGKNLLVGKSPDELAAIARTTSGSDGRCMDYVSNIATKLAELGISDPDVDELCRALNVERVP